jgi:hypothetical protein
MLEPARPQIPNPILFRNADLSSLLGNLADARDRYAVDSLWQTRYIVGPDCEQEFKILAAM